MTREEKKETEDGNNVIAEFMGYTAHISKVDKNFHSVVIPEKLYPQYHYSWDWLMPVVAKCCEEISKRQDVNARGGWTPEHGYTEDIYTMILNSPIEKVWKAALFYIKKNKEKK